MCLASEKPSANRYVSCDYLCTIASNPVKKEILLGTGSTLPSVFRVCLSISGMPIIGVAANSMPDCQPLVENTGLIKYQMLLHTRAG